MGVLDDLRIDKYALDKEWLEQPQRYQIYSEFEARAEKEQDEARRNLDLVRAELDSDIRQNPSEYSLKEKPTEAAISNVILSQEKYKDAQQRYIDAKYNLNVLTGNTKSFEHRKSALENLVKLSLSGYYSRPVSPTKEHEEVMEEEIRKEVNEIMDHDAEMNDLKRKMRRRRDE